MLLTVWIFKKLKFSFLAIYYIVDYWFFVFHNFSCHIIKILYFNTPWANFGYVLNTRPKLLTWWMCVGNCFAASSDKNSARTCKKPSSSKFPQVSLFSVKDNCEEFNVEQEALIEKSRKNKLMTNNSCFLCRTELFRLNRFQTVLFGYIIRRWQSFVRW